MNKVWISVALIFATLSCSKEIKLEQSDSKNYQNNAQHNLSDTSIIHDFDLKASFFESENLKSTQIDDNVYNSFDIGYNVISRDKKQSVFLPHVDMSQIVNTTFDDRNTVMEYYSSTNYNEVSKKVSSKISASLNIDVRKVEIDAKLNIENQTQINSSSNSVYISVLYIKKYGDAYLKYSVPNINDFLIHKSNLVHYNGCSDDININPTQFRERYGDRFRSKMSFGVLLVATFQLTNVDFSRDSEKNIAASAKLAVKNMVNINTSFESEKKNHEAFKNSTLIIEGRAIPDMNFIYSRSDLVNTISQLDNRFNNGEVGILASEYSDYSALYPCYNFFNYQYYNDRLKAWLDARNDMILWKSDIKSANLNSIIQHYIEECNQNISKCYQLQDVPFPSFEDLKNLIREDLTEDYIFRWGGRIIQRPNGHDVDPELYLYPKKYFSDELKPLYLFSKKNTNGWSLATDNYDDCYKYGYYNVDGLVGYVYKEKINNDLLPLYRYVGPESSTYNRFKYSVGEPWGNSSYTRWPREIIGYVYDSDLKD